MDKILQQKMYNTYYNMKQRCYNPKSKKLRNEKLKELQMQGETKCKWVYLKNKNQLIGNGQWKMIIQDKW